MKILVLVKLLILLMSIVFIPQGWAQETTRFLRFTVMAMAPDPETRATFEDELVSVLQQDNYDVVPSHTLVPVVDPETSREVRQALLEADIHAVLVIRPLVSGADGSIESAQTMLSPQAYGSLSAFINEYRGHNFESQAVVHVVGYLLDVDRSNLFWQGVVWLDDTVDTQQEAIDKLVNLVQFNLNQSRPALRRQLGLPPLIITQ